MNKEIINKIVTEYYGKDNVELESIKVVLLDNYNKLSDFITKLQGEKINITQNLNDFLNNLSEEERNNFINGKISNENLKKLDYNLSNINRNLESLREEREYCLFRINIVNNMINKNNKEYSETLNDQTNKLR